MGFLDHPRGVWWRRLIFQVHLWVGVCIGLYVVAISLSGSILVFERNMLNDAPQLGHDSVRGPATWGQMAAVALRAHPGATLDDIDMRSAHRRVASIGLKDKGYARTVYVDSETCDIVRDELLPKRHPFVEFAENLHNQLADGIKGAWFNGVGGALLFVMSGTGIVLWWPGKRAWKRALTVRWDARWARLNWDLHCAFGFWCVLFVSMWGLSGAYFIYPKPFNTLLTAFSSMPHLQELSSDWQPAQIVLPIDTFVKRAVQMYPQDELAYLYMDTYRPHGVVKVFLSPTPSMPLTLREDVVSFQPATGRILSSFSSSEWTTGERLAVGIYSVHFGDFGGLPVKIVWALLGVVPVLLTFTGFVMWWNRVLRRTLRHGYDRRPDLLLRPAGREVIATRCHRR